MNLAKTLVLTCAALGLSVAAHAQDIVVNGSTTCLLYTSPSPRDA